MADQSGSSLGAVGGNSKRPTASKRWIFTFNNYEKYKNGVAGLAEEFSKFGLYVFQEERGEQGTPHLQGCIEFNTPGRPLERIKVDGIHWDKCKDWEASLKYCTKEESRSGQIYTNIDSLKPIEVDEPYGWQLEVMDIIKTKPDKRTIYWFWESKGNMGKTSLAKYLCVKYKALYIGGSAADIKCAVAQMPVKPVIIILGIPKCTEHISYKALEEIKDGLFFSGKYESGMVVMNNPHVFVFANEPPDVTMLSFDRWKIKCIRDDDPWYKKEIEE